MRFIPVEFGSTDCTIGQTNQRSTLQLTPAAFAEYFSKAFDFANARSDRDCRYALDCPNNLKLFTHGRFLVSIGGNFILRFLRTHQPLIEPADDVLQPFDAMPRLA